MSIAEPSRWDVAVLGAGAAGLLAAARAAERGRRTLLVEKNRRPGVKILISGGTRCNLTHDTDAAGIIAAFGPPGRFLHSALAALGPRELLRLFEDEGVATKIEPPGKVFPTSDKAADVLAALLARLRRSGCTLAVGEPVVDLRRAESGFAIHTATRILVADKVVVTTGGQSYPGCGTTGDAYAWMAALGHSIVPPRPALSPITSDAPWVTQLQGVTIPDVTVSVVESPNAPSPHARTTACGFATPPSAKPAPPLAHRRASLLFTHFGLSGPAAMDVSRVVSAHPQPRCLCLLCDLLPDLRADLLENDLRSQCLAAGKRHVLGLVPPAIPRRLASALLELAAVNPQRHAAELSKTDRRRLVDTIKALPIPISGTRGFKKAEVTAGGVDLAEIDSRTMHSKRTPNLYVAGELLDLDGPIGGYNFQAAFSTGWLAGQSV